MFLKKKNFNFFQVIKILKQDFGDEATILTTFENGYEI